MRFLGWEITRRKDTLVPQDGRGWYRILEPFTGAWQRNVECDAPARLTAFSAVYACIDYIASDISTLPLNLVKKDDDGIWSVVDGDSPFWPVLRKPNAYQNRAQFIQLWLISKLTTGNTYALKERDGRGVVRRLYILDPSKVQARYTDDGRVFYALATDTLNGLPGDVNVPSSEIIHDLAVPLFHPLAGVSPLYSCGMAATMGARIQQQSATFFANGARPSGILSSDGEIKDELAEKYKTRWQEGYTGPNAGKVAVLGNGLKYQTIAMQADQAQLIEQLRWTAQDVARAFGVPAYMIGADSQPGTQTAATEATRNYLRVLRKYIENIELCLDEGLGIGPAMGSGETANLGTEFDVDVLQRMDQAALVVAEKEAVGAGIKSPNEARRRFNLSPVKGGASPLLQQQYYSLEALAERDENGPFAKPEPAANDESQDEMRSFIKSLAC